MPIVDWMLGRSTKKKKKNEIYTSIWILHMISMSMLASHSLKVAIISNVLDVCDTTMSAYFPTMSMDSIIIMYFAHDCYEHASKS